MIPPEIEAWLVRSLQDRQVSRNERQTLAEYLKTTTTPLDRDAFTRRAFELARGAVAAQDDGGPLIWLEAVLRIGGAETAAKSTGPDVAESYFSPGDDAPKEICYLLSRTTRTAEICVFTITDDRLADAVLDLHRRKVAVRIITDDAKAEDLGSDVIRFERAGMALRVDRSPFHMHHKFAILDGKILLTGSYNWTRGAARDNQENFIVTSDPRFLAPFGQTFERLWASLA